MKLTKFDKEAFVRACIDDVPQINYSEIARTKLMAWAKVIMPDVVQKAYELNPAYFETRWVYTPSGLDHVYLPVVEGGHIVRDKYPDVWAELVQLGADAKAQNEKINNLRGELSGAIGACSTLKQALERLPEFAKYLPADRDGKTVCTLPVANLIANLTNAGWPKDKPLAQGA